MDEFKKETHESYGMAGFYRTTCSQGHALFGSSIKHRDTIRLRIGTADVCRGLNTDWYHKDKDIIEIEMSQSQFADLITSFNVGDGVPVTIRRLNGKGLEDCPYIDKGEVHLNEYKQHLATQNNLALQLINDVKEVFEKKSFTKADKQEVLSLLTRLYNEVKPNEEYQVRAFQEQMDATTKEAKGEIEAFFENRIRSIAQTKLLENTDEIKKLAEYTDNPIEF